MLVKLAICLANNAFRDYKTIDEVLTLEPLDGEMYQLEWDPSVLDTPFYQDAEGEIDKANEFSTQLRALGFRAGYMRPPVQHDFRAEGLYLIGISTFLPPPVSHAPKNISYG